MPRCSVPQLVTAIFALLVLVAAPGAAARLSPGLPGHPTTADYARCTVRSFFVTPKPPVGRRALPQGIEAANRRAEKAVAAEGGAKGRG